MEDQWMQDPSTQNPSTQPKSPTGKRATGKIFRRDSQAYRDRQLAWQLRRSPEWKELLFPLLRQKAETEVRPNIFNLDDCFQLNRLHAEINYVRDLLNRLERLANEFVTLE